jgi:beta-glucanase (GH16 family)
MKKAVVDVLREWLLNRKALVFLWLASYALLVTGQDAVERNTPDALHTNADSEGEVLVVVDGGQIGPAWGNGISAWDQAIDYQSCSNDGGAACPTVSWNWVAAAGRGEVFRASWANNNQEAAIYFQTLNPLNLTRFAGGVVEFDIRAVDGESRVIVEAVCVYPCASGSYRPTNIITENWQRIAVPVDWLVDSGLDLGKVSDGFVFRPSEGHRGITFEIDNVLWRTASGGLVDEEGGDSDSDNPTADLDDLDGSGNVSPKTYPGMRLGWADEFNGTALDSQLWSYDIGGSGWGNNESQYYRPENTSVQSGYLVITAEKDPFGGKEYTSSRIKTEGAKSFTYGRVDIRAALPRGQGIWPALWSLGTNFSEVGWPYSGEIDIMEMIGGSGRETEVHGTVHWNEGGLNAPYNHRFQGGKIRKTSGSFSDGFNVFSLIRTENQIQWLVNDQIYHSQNIDNSPSLAPFRKPFFLILNVAVGGNWPGYPDATTVFPQRLVVDYVRVFEFGSEPEPEPELTSTAPSRLNQLMSAVGKVRGGSAKGEAASSDPQAKASNGSNSPTSRRRIARGSNTVDYTDAAPTRDPVPVPVADTPYLPITVCLLALMLVRKLR